MFSPHGEQLCVLCSAFCVLTLSFAALAITATPASAQANADLQWKWDANSPSATVVDASAAVKTYKITAKGQVEFLRGVIIDSVGYLVYHGTTGANGYEETPTAISPATLGAVTAHPTVAGRDFRTAVSDPIKKDGNNLLVSGGRKLKIVARVKYKFGANDPAITSLLELPGFVMTPADANDDLLPDGGN